MNMAGDYSKELESALRYAREAGRLILSYANSGLKVSKKTDNDITSEADSISNDRLVKLISSEFPSDAILSEDKKDDKTRLSKDRLWIIDPLDGTKNFIDYARTKTPRYFGVHIGLVVGGTPVLGVVYFPKTEEIFYAEKGQGAFVKRGSDEKRLHVRTNLPGKKNFYLAPSVHENKALKVFVKKVEKLSSDADFVFGYPVVQVAEGNYGVYVAFPENPRKIGEWDVCAPGLILEEAGGKITDLQGKSIKFNQSSPYISTGICASNNSKHEKLIQMIIKEKDKKLNP